MNNTTIHRLATASLTGILVLGLAGCGKIAEKATEKMVEKGIEAGTGAKFDVDSKGGKMKIETDEGSLVIDGDDDGNFRMETEDGSYRGGSGMPDGWPDDIALFPGLSVEGGSSMDSSDGDLVVVMGTASDAPQDIVEFYAEELTGWEENTRTSSSGDAYRSAVASWTRGDRVLMVNAHAEDGESSVQIQHMSGID